MTASTRTISPAPEAAELHVHRPGISNPVLGMILFITSEVMFFAGLFAAYFNVRSTTPHWPPPGNPHFLIQNDRVLPTILTIILVTSSITCQLGIRAIKKNDRRGLGRALAVTLVLGITFLVGQAYDYSQLGFGLSDGTFGTTFYTLTGFHGAHVLAGTIMLAVMFYRTSTGQFSARHHDAVEATSLYWHFVDVVWIALYSTLYWLP